MIGRLSRKPAVDKEQQPHPVTKLDQFDASAIVAGAGNVQPAKAPPKNASGTLENSSRDDDRSAHAHAVPASVEDLKRSLGFMLAWLASHTDHQVQPAYSMLLSRDGEVVSSGISLMVSAINNRHSIAAERARAPERQRLESPGTEPSDEPSDEPKPAYTNDELSAAHLDLESALRIALLDCEAKSSPVTAHTLRTVEDEQYPGYKIRVRRRFSLKVWTVIAFLLGVVLETYYLYMFGSPGKEIPFMPSFAETYAINSLKYFMWGVLGAALYLMRQMYHFVEARTFDTAMVGAYGLRLMIGGVAGMLIAGMFFPSLVDVGTVGDPSKLSALAAEFGERYVDEALYLSVVAVLSGFGARAVYVIFERAIEGLIRRVSGADSAEKPIGLSGRRRDVT
jgi:hypothetical protein